MIFFFFFFLARKSYRESDSVPQSRLNCNEGSTLGMQMFQVTGCPPPPAPSVSDVLWRQNVQHPEI